MAEARRPGARAGNTAELLLAAALCAVVACGLVPAAMAAPQTHTVAIAGMRYVPETLTVRRGERIVWVNRDVVPHTVTHKSFDSGVISPDATWTYVASAPGRYSYGCALHPTMKATLIVQ